MFLCFFKISVFAGINCLVWMITAILLDYIICVLEHLLGIILLLINRIDSIHSK